MNVSLAEDSRGGTYQPSCVICFWMNIMFNKTQKQQLLTGKQEPPDISFQSILSLKRNSWMGEF